VQPSRFKETVMKYLRLLLAGVAVPVASIIVISAIASGYAFKLAFAVRSSPNQIQISQFAQTLGRAWWTPLQVVLTVLLSMFITRKDVTRATAYGTIVGAVVAAIDIIFVRELSARLILDLGLMVGAGWLGGLLGGWRARRDLPSL
jgi:hypothetical protein